MCFGFWIAFTWFAICTSRPLGRWLNASFLDESQIDYLEGSPLDRAVYAVLIFLAVTVLVGRRVAWRHLFKSNIWILVLMAYLSSSLLWSDYPGVSAKRSLKLLGSLAIALLLVTGPRTTESFQSVLRKCFYLHIPLSILFIKFFTHFGVGGDSLENGMWLGVTTHKNSLGELTMLSAIFFIWSIINHQGGRLKNYAYLCMSLYLLLGSRSQTSLLVFIIGTLLMLTLRLTRSNLAAIKTRTTALAILIICCSLILPFRPEVFLQNLFGGLVSSAGRDFTLTGRTDLWYDLLNIASRHPIVGVGYGSFWIGDVSHSLWDTHYWLPTQAHNGYLDVYLELGLLGIAILVPVLLSGIRAITEGFDTYFENSQLRITLMIILLLHNMTESSFLRGDHHLWFLFLLITLRPPAPLEAHAAPAKNNTLDPAYMLSGK